MEGALGTLTAELGTELLSQLNSGEQSEVCTTWHRGIHTCLLDLLHMKLIAKTLFCCIVRHTHLPIRLITHETDSKDPLLLYCETYTPAY